MENKTQMTKLITREHTTSWINITNYLKVNIDSEKDTHVKIQLQNL